MKIITQSTFQRKPISLLVSQYLLGLAALSGVAMVSAQPSIEGAQIELIEVKGQALRNTAWSTTSFSAADIRALKLTDTQELFRSVPGMNIRHYGLAGVADTISIRGFGGGGHGGDLGVVIDGIPLNEAMSHADGYVDLGVVVPLEIGAMTVYKGPVSALYGNYNRGGLVSLETRKSGQYGEVDVRLGSDSTADLQTAWGTDIGETSQINLAAQIYRSDGYRPQSDTERGTLAGRFRTDVTERFSVSVSARVHESDNKGASYLTATQYHNEPDGIDPRVQNDGADKSFATVRIDSAYAISDELQLLAFAYGTKQEFSRWFTRPVGGGTWRQREESYDRKVSGMGLNLNGQGSFNATELNWVTGVEAFRESTDFIYYDGINNRVRVNPPITNRESELDNESVFAELQADVHHLFMPSVGIRYDRFSGGCSLNGPETGADPCGALNDMSNLSPKIGIRSAISNQLMLRASWSEGFALPNGFVKYNQSARNLDPVIFRQLEAGANYQISDDLAIDLVAYRLRSSDEVRTVAPGVFENYGATDRTGFETSISWTPSQDIELSWIYGVSDSEILSNSNAAIVGNEVGGVAKYNSNVTLNWSISEAMSFETSWRRVGGYALNANNVDYADSYSVLDMGLSYINSNLPGWRFHFNVDNVTDKRYATSEFVIGGEAVVAAGAPRQFQVGTQFQF
jgi:iron complex outermembrane receptor protein